MSPSLKFHKVEMPLVTPFTTSFGTEKIRSAYILELSHDGITAYSETVTGRMPDYGYEDNITVFHIIKDFLAGMISDVPEPDEFMKRAGRIKGHNMAKAAVEMLLWDYYSKLKGTAMHRYLGESKGYADVGISIGMDTPEMMVKRVSDALQKGYKRIKVKIMKGMEHPILSSIRDAFPEIPLSVDANTDYSIHDIDLLKTLDKYDLVYIEQPMDYDDLIYHSRLSRELSTPICLDESITSPARARKAFEIGACSVINIKPGRVGGFGNSLEIAKITREAGGHVWIGGMLETGIGRSFNVSLASNALIDYPGDTSPNSKYFHQDIVRNPFEMSNGIVKPNEGDGIGVEVDQDFLAKVTSESGFLLK